MGRTIGRHLPEEHRFDPTALCSYCGTLYYRSRLRRDRSGNLVCEMDEGEDRVSLEEGNARAAHRRRHRAPPDGARGYAAEDQPMPRIDANLEVWLDGSNGITTDDDGRLTEAVCRESGRVFVPSVGGVRGPLWTGQEINGRQALGLFDEHGLEYVVGEPIGNSSHTLFMVIDAPEPVDGTVQGLLRFWSFGQSPITLSYVYWDTGTETHRVSYNAGAGTVNVDAGTPTAGKRLLVIDLADGATGLTYDGETAPFAVRTGPALVELQYGDVQTVVSFEDVSQPFGGVIGEILHFAPAITDTRQRTMMVDWLNARWGLI